MSQRSQAIGSGRFALYLAAALAVAPAAFAQTPNGTAQFQDITGSAYRDQVVRQSAGSAAATGSNSQFQDVTGSAYREQVIRQSAGSGAASDGGRVVSTVPTVDGKQDVVGAHGAQDATAREIYQPGRNPTGW